MARYTPLPATTAMARAHGLPDGVTLAADGGTLALLGPGDDGTALQASADALAVLWGEGPPVTAAWRPVTEARRDLARAARLAAAAGAAKVAMTDQQGQAVAEQAEAIAAAALTGRAAAAAYDLATDRADRAEGERLLAGMERGRTVQALADSAPAHGPTGTRGRPPGGFQWLSALTGVPRRTLEDAAATTRERLARWMAGQTARPRPSGTGAGPKAAGGDRDS